MAATAAKQLTLQDRILQIDHIQARRFAKLSGVTMDIATEGIIRHLRACARMAREGRNPATGDTIKIPAKTTVKFRLGKAMKDAVGSK